MNKHKLIVIISFRNEVEKWVGRILWKHFWTRVDVRRFWCLEEVESIRIFLLTFHTSDYFHEGTKSRGENCCWQTTLLWIGHRWQVKCPSRILSGWSPGKIFFWIAFKQIYLTLHWWQFKESCRHWNFQTLQYHLKKFASSQQVWMDCAWRFSILLSILNLFPKAGYDTTSQLFGDIFDWKCLACKQIVRLESYTEECTVCPQDGFQMIPLCVLKIRQYESKTRNCGFRLKGNKTIKFITFSPTCW